MTPHSHHDMDTASPSLSLEIYHLRIERDGRVRIGGFFSTPPDAGDDDFRVEAQSDVDVSATVGGFLRPPEKEGESPTSRRRFVDFFLAPPKRKPFRVAFHAKDAVGRPLPCRVAFAAAAPLSEKTRSSYFRQGGWLFRSEPPDGFSVRPASFLRHLGWELRYDFWILFRSVGLRNRACIPVRWAILLLRPLLLRRRIWLVMDRISFADDNGLALSRHLVARRKELGCRPVFFLNRNSPDWKTARAVGPVRHYTPFRYCLAALGAEWIVSSASIRPVLHPLEASASDGYRGLASDLRAAFLQHGVILHDLSRALNRARIDMTLFVTTAERERDSILGTESYGYDENTVVLTGLPRHDLLQDKRERIVTFLPTWRAALFAGRDPKTGKGRLKDGFEDSPFFRHLCAALSDRRLLDAAERLGYAIDFFPHPEWQPFLDRFVLDPRVRKIPAGTKYRDIFARSAACVTDWSSAVFDFAWLGKPVVYYQPDNDLHYQAGYFDYAADGFGPVTHTPQELTNILVYLMERDCPMDEPYRSRAATFFAFRDRDNSRRVTEEILKASDGR